MSENITDRLKLIIADELDVNVKQEELNEDTSLFEEGIGLDSVAIMEFIALIEARFEIRFSDTELTMEPFKDLRTLAGFISSKLEN